MCRHLAYLGPARTISDVLTTGSHSLLEQSWAPNDMRCDAVMNADGYGATWWSRSGTRSHRSQQPIWNDPAVSEVLTEVSSTAVVAAIRSATIGMPITHTANAPFSDGTWAFSHNGVVRDWPESLAALGESVPAVDWMRTPAATDSASLWVLLQHALRTRPPDVALRELTEEVLAAAPGSRLNLLLSDGTTVWATAVHHSLSVRVDDTSVWVASEPLGAATPGNTTEGQWRSVPDGSFVTATIGEPVVLSAVGEPAPVYTQE
ncbi:ergothioneine biosynthesis protein EgtC [Williamsia sterculiae]|uniref:Gamma-glutamyl-hercynylcysteine sulfoxide hydrolase n=1 Tax=Williamsia sterculiae TaxID=1344003 RepID=A0A1N7FLH7_9NOCA|nr:ergothioneine biosynthesis protein EgtC [Williamsia sterculiae]SIS01181.1 glutamine amidotransferase [Williamsia sterculiae]